MTDLFWENGGNVFRNDKKIVKFLKFKEVLSPLLYLKEFNEINGNDRTIELNRSEAQEIHNKINHTLFTSELQFPFKVKDIIVENENQAKEVYLTLSAYLENRLLELD